MYSISKTVGEHIFIKHICVLGASVLIIIILRSFDLERLSLFIYTVGIILLFISYFFGAEFFGAKRWVYAGFFTVQPSEISKVSTIFGLSYILRNGISIRTFLLSVLMASIPFILIFRQPDLGSSLSILFISGCLLLSAGLKIRVASVIVLLVVIASPFIWNQMKDYQKKRVLTMLNPEQDILGSGYQTTQAKIAVGSGGLFGVGFTRGVHGKLWWIPNMYSDFVFSVFAEEWGLIFSVLIILLYLTLVLLLILSSYRKYLLQDFYSLSFIVGSASLIFFHSFVNISMVLGLMPVVGIPLTFISYAGTHNISAAVLLGVSENCIRRRKKNYELL